MSIANALGEIFRRELDAQLVPLQEAVRRMEEGLEALELLRAVTHRLAPLTSRLGAMAGVRPAAAALESTRARGGRKQAVAATRSRASGVKTAEARPVGGRVRAEEGSRACAVIGCDRPSRSKGYCSAHYQKLRLLMRTNRRPAAWTDDAPPQSVEEVTLPRGRAASKALREGGVSEQTPAPAPAAKQDSTDAAEQTSATGKKARAAKKAAGARRGAAAKKTSAAKKAPAAKKTSAAKKAPAAKKASGARKGAAAKKAAGARKGAAVKKTSAAKKAPAAKKTSAAKKAPAAKKASGARKGAAAKKAPAKGGRKVKATAAKAGKRKRAGKSSAQGSLF
ncbi:cell wall protein [Corallococcus macrosporus]|uniref:cell wall protein n=1 Tax=Corallococcus macrosporus TaxID=35 RepID=UPI001EE666AD|nr:cell wall protein [Corallococcus macrosporus]